MALADCWTPGLSHIIDPPLLPVDFELSKFENAPYLGCLKSASIKRCALSTDPSDRLLYRGWDGQGILQ